MKIGELAATTKTQVETIRFYEHEGLLPEPLRTSSNYRFYDDFHVARLTFIRRCRALDLGLDAIRELLQVKDAPGASCAAVNELLDDHIALVAAKLRELRSLQRDLKSLRSLCTDGRSGTACGILEELGGAPAVNGGGAHPRLTYDALQRLSG